MLTHGLRACAVWKTRFLQNPASAGPDQCAPLQLYSHQAYPIARTFTRIQGQVSQYSLPIFPYALTASALLKAATVTSGAITNRIDRMEVKGLVERVRDLDDRRSVLVRLTPHGREVVDGLLSPHLANAAQMLRSLNPEECEQLASTLRKLLESFGDISLK